MISDMPLFENIIGHSMWWYPALRKKTQSVCVPYLTKKVPTPTIGPISCLGQSLLE